MCLVYLRGRTTLDSAKLNFLFSVSLVRLCQCRVTSDFALVWGAVDVGHSYPLYLGIRTQRARCRGVKCTSDVTYDICRDWSVAQLEAFLKRCPYSERRKKRLTGSTLPSAAPTLPPSASAPSGARRPAPPPRSLPPPSEGRDRSGKTEGVPRVGSHEVSPPPSHRSGGEGGTRSSASAGMSDSAASSLPRGRGSGIIVLTGVSCAR